MRWTLFLAALGAAAGCKQGLGDRCQIDDDCDTGLVCSTGGSSHVCVPESTLMGIDAGPAVDAKPAVDAAPPPPDAPPPDAPLPDAPLGPDAS